MGTHADRQVYVLRLTRSAVYARARESRSVRQPRARVTRPDGAAWMRAPTACGPSTDKHQNGGIDEPRGSQCFASPPREGRISPVADDFLLRPQTGRQWPRRHQRGVMDY